MLWLLGVHEKKQIVNSIKTTLFIMKLITQQYMS